MRDQLRDQASQKRDLVVMAHEVHDGRDTLATWGIEEAVQ